MDVLSRIVAVKEREIEVLRARASREDWPARIRDLPPPPDFLAALRAPGRIRVIAEIKRASPSAGILREHFDPPAIARQYLRGGADCLSVLTDREFFQGSIDHLSCVRQAVPLPLLRKDFILDPAQIHEARLAGAAAALLIAECLTPARLADLVGGIQESGMTPLVELHDAENLEAALASGSPLLGINNRDLRTFHTDIGRTMDLVRSIPAGRTVVSESGIRARADVERLAAAGVHAILVGEAFMRAADPGEKLAELIAPPAGK